LTRLGKKAEAKAAYSEVIKKYPKSSSARKLQKEMN
jgi:TolA-binding protein